MIELNGSQSYVSEGTTEAMYNYQVVTGASRTSILTQAVNDDLTLSQIHGAYKRVIVVRYTGEIREVYPDDYNKYKDSLAKGIYQPIIFYWTQADGDYNQTQATAATGQASGILHQVVQQWFAGQLNQLSDDLTVTPRLSIDIDAYNSPLL